MKKALITGITGQDGSYLAELLLEKGYEVHGLVRRVALEDPKKLWRISHILEKIVLHQGALESYTSLFNIFGQVQPDECYHLAAQSFVSYAFEDESATLSTNIEGTLAVISAIRERAPRCRFYFAGSSEMFGLAESSPQDENTRFNPRSLYGISKLAGFHIVKNHRERFNMFAASGILYNHESPRRGLEFVTRKITHSAAEIKAGQRKELRLGNLDAKRDWGFSKDYVEAVWLMLQQDTPEDFVIATGETHTVREFVQEAFACAGLDWEKHVVVDENFYRPAEKVALRGDAAKAREKLGWKPKAGFKELVRMMVDEDIKKVSGISQR